MQFYKIKILKTGANHFMEKNVCAANIDLAKDAVLNYLGKQCAEDYSYSMVDVNYHFRSVHNDELKFKVAYAVATKGEFEFTVDLNRDFKLEKFPEDIEVFNFINFPNTEVKS